MRILSMFGWRKDKAVKTQGQQRREDELLATVSRIETLLAKIEPGLSRNVNERRLIQDAKTKYIALMREFPSAIVPMKRILTAFLEVYKRLVLSVLAKHAKLSVAELEARFGADCSRSDSRGVIFVDFTDDFIQSQDEARLIGAKVKNALESIEPGGFADVDWASLADIGSLRMMRIWMQDCFFDEKYRRSLVTIKR